MKNIKPPWTKLGKKLESACRKALFDFNLIEHNSIAIALSGGKDSLGLLCLLAAISGNGFPKLNLHAIHVENTALSNNTDLIEDICRKLGIPLTMVKMTLPKSKLTCYRCSRQKRNLIFDEAKKKNIATIAFGHHRDDNAQTLLLNLLHKGEFAGILPKIKMHSYGITIIRPLIYISEKDLYHFIRLPKKKNTCPQELISKRKIVNQIINNIEKQFPSAGTNLASASLQYGSKKAALNNISKSATMEENKENYEK